jgi:hypothetical protein
VTGLLGDWTGNPNDTRAVLKRFHDVVRAATLGHLVGHENWTTFHCLRPKGTGPKFIKRGSRVFYIRTQQPAHDVANTYPELWVALVEGDLSRSP